MAVAERAREFLTLDQLHLPPSPPVVDVQVEDIVDWSGDDALRVNVILDEATTDAQLKGRNSFVIKDAIHNELKQHGIDLFPYVYFVKQSELKTPPDDEA